MELAELLQAEGLDADEVLTWARARAEELLADGPSESELGDLLKGLPTVLPIKRTDSSDLPPPPSRPPSQGAEEDEDALLGAGADEFSGLNTGNFDAVDVDIDVDEEGDEDASKELNALQTGEYEVVNEEIAADDSGELEALQSGEYEMVDPDEVEELDMEELEEYESGEYEILQDEEGAPEKVDAEDSVDIDIDI